MKTFRATFEGSPKEYSFNTNNDIKVGDEIQTNEYKAKITITEVLEESFKYFNFKTKELTNTYEGSVVNVKEVTII